MTRRNQDALLVLPRCTCGGMDGGHAASSCAYIVAVRAIAQARAEERAAATYIDPNGEEVLAHRDERHIVLPAEEVRRLRAAEERLAALKEGTEPVADAEPGGIAVDPTPVGDEEPAPAADVPSYPYTQERYIERERVGRVIAEVRDQMLDPDPHFYGGWCAACDAIEAALGEGGGGG